MDAGETMAGKTKAGDALETLLRRLNAGRPAAERLTPNMLTARLRLEERYGDDRKRLQVSGQHEPLVCEGMPDRFVLTGTADPVPALPSLGYAARPPQPLWDRNYRFVSRFKGTGSIRLINVEHDPNYAWLHPFRITVLPSDATGVKASDFRPIWESVSGLSIVLLEAAFDFPLGSAIDVDFIRAHFLSGKMRLLSHADPLHERWPGASRTIRAYAKWETGKLRLEVEAHSRLLRAKGINDLFDIQRLAALLVPKYVFFARLDRASVMRLLTKRGVPLERMQEIDDALAARAGSLWQALQYLRRVVGLTNTRRFLIPMTDLNRMVAEAAQRWAAQYPTTPTNLGGRND